jgi:flagellar motor switch protein FliG
MTEAASSIPAELTEIEKSAIMMTLIGQDTAAQVVKFLSAPEIARLSAAMTRVGVVSHSTAASVLREFADLMQRDGTLTLEGSEDYVRGVLEKALGTLKADRLLGRLKPGGYSPGIAAVKWQDPRDLAEMIKSEHPQIVAMIAAYLEPKQAQAMLQHLPDELIKQVIPRLAVLDALPPTAIQELNESLEELLSGEPQQARLSVGGVDAAAKILNRIGGAGNRRFVIDRDDLVDRISVDELLVSREEAFLVENFSQRLAFLVKPGALASVDPLTPVAVGDIAFLLRRDGTADAAIVVGDGIGPLRLKMYNPEEEIPIDDYAIAGVLRIRMLILP